MSFKAMSFTGRRWRCAPIAASLLALTLVLALTSGASADATNPTPSDFAICPTSFVDAQSGIGMSYCVHSVVSGGLIQLGSSTVPITSPGDTLDFGTLDLQGVGQTGPQALLTPTNGQMFGGPAQTVPGGLFGLLSPSSVPAFLQGQLASALSASIVLAGPATPSTDVDRTATSAFFIGFNALTGGVFLHIPVKIQLHNQFLGSSCYIGSNSNPIVLALQPNTTSPPPPNQPITGNAGNFEILDGAEVITLTGATYVDNALGVPAATGCGSGGALDAAINRKEHLPSPAGRNAVILNTDTELSVSCFAEGTC